MLVVSRKLGEGVRVGNNVIISVVEIKGSKIRLGVTADDGVTILRAELYEDSSENDGAAARDVRDVA